MKRKISKRRLDFRELNLLLQNLSFIVAQIILGLYFTNSCLGGNLQYVSIQY